MIFYTYYGIAGKFQKPQFMRILRFLVNLENIILKTINHSSSSVIILPPSRSNGSHLVSCSHDHLAISHTHCVYWLDMISGHTYSK